MPWLLDYPSPDEVIQYWIQERCTLESSTALPTLHKDYEKFVRAKGWPRSMSEDQFRQRTLQYVRMIQTEKGRQFQLKLKV